jgi:dTMP kinase
VTTPARGYVVAFEGLDQSGKQTQAERLAAQLRAQGRQVEFLSFPEYPTAIGQEIGRALAGDREYAADTLQLLYVANRFEFRPLMEGWLAAGAVIICDRYTSSSIAYGEAQGLSPAWLQAVQQPLPAADITLLLDIPPEVSLQRKQAARDRFERDLPLLARVRDSYRRQSHQPGWVLIDGQQTPEAVAAAVQAAVRGPLGLPSAPSR